MNPSAPPASYLGDKLRAHHERVGRAVAVASAAAAAELAADAPLPELPEVDPAA